MAIFFFEVSIWPQSSLHIEIEILILDEYSAMDAEMDA